MGRDCLLFQCHLSSVVVPSTKTITGCKSSEVKSQGFYIVPQVVYFVITFCLICVSCFLLYNLQYCHLSIFSEVSNLFIICAVSEVLFNLIYLEFLYVYSGLGLCTIASENTLLS